MGDPESIEVFIVERALGIHVVSLVIALAAVHVPLGDYMYRVYSSTKDSRAESIVYRLIGADPKAEQTWGAYARSVLAFSAVGILFLFAFPRVPAWRRGL